MVFLISGLVLFFAASATGVKIWARLLTMPLQPVVMQSPRPALFCRSSPVALPLLHRTGRSCFWQRPLPVSVADAVGADVKCLDLSFAIEGTAGFPLESLSML